MVTIPGSAGRGAGSSDGQSIADAVTRGATAKQAALEGDGGQAGAERSAVEVVVKVKDFRSVVVLPVRGSDDGKRAPVSRGAVPDLRRGEDVHVDLLLAGCRNLRVVLDSRSWRLIGYSRSSTRTRRTLERRKSPQKLRYRRSKPDRTQS